MALVGQGLDPHFPSEMTRFCTAWAGGAIIFDGFVYILFKKKMSLWTGLI